MQPTYLDFLRELYEHVEFSLSDAGLAALATLNVENGELEPQTADEVADRLTAATSILGQDWDTTTPARRRMLLHIAQLPFGTLRFLEQRILHLQTPHAIAGDGPAHAQAESGSVPPHPTES